MPIMSDSNESRRKVGFIVNPVAGIGGRVGLKGSDGQHIQAEAFARGAKPEAVHKATLALEELLPQKGQLTLLCAPGHMGADIAAGLGFDVQVIDRLVESDTSADDTMRIAAAICNEQPDLLLFAGGDGTARDVFNATDGTLPVIGIPAGVKIHSAVYANNPRSAGKAARQFLGSASTMLRDAEVMDIDEELFRQNQVQARLYGYMRVPVIKNLIQHPKAAARGDEHELTGIAHELRERMVDSDYYIFGTGSTTYRIMQALGMQGTLLGVDVVHGGQVILRDADEQSLLNLLSDKAGCQLVVTVIGGQGHVFGRGNQQLSPAVIRLIGLDHIWIIAAPAKIYALPEPVLLVDTGDDALDRQLSGYRRVITGWQEALVCEVRC